MSHWRRIAPQALVFGLGAVSVLVGLRGYDALRAVGRGRAEQELLRRLATAPTKRPIDESQAVLAATRIQPCVVNVDTLQEESAGPTNRVGLPPSGSVLRHGKASGVVVSADGFVVTNNHVVAGASVIRVTLASGAHYDGTIVGADATSDVALLRVPASGLPFAELGDSDRLRVGEEVLAIGNPFGIGTTVTHGIISATDRRDLNVGEGVFLRHALQTDAPINRGNSGGALANLYGQLIGINTAILSDRGANVGIGFAVPSNALRSILRDLITRGKPEREPPSEPFLGIVFMGLTPDMSAQLDLPPGRGVIVLEVRPLSSAEDAGLRRGDVILAIDGHPVVSQQDLAATLHRRRIGAGIRLRLLRGNGTEEITVVVGSRRKDAPPAR